MIFKRRSAASTGKARRSFLKDERGVTLIEFGLLAIPFFALIGAILETAIVFLSGQIFDSAVDDAARLIRTGQAQSQNFNITSFRNQVCSRLYGLFNCSEIRIRVNVVTNFSTATVSSPIVINGNESTWQLTQAYNAGQRNDVILVQAYYKWPIILNFAGFALRDLPDNTRLLGAVRVFRNEPF